MEAFSEVGTDCEQFPLSLFLLWRDRVLSPTLGHSPHDRSLTAEEREGERERGGGGVRERRDNTQP